jgi:glycerate-2-kinase
VASTRSVATAIEVARRAIGACHAGTLTARSLEDAEARAELSRARRIVGIATGKAAVEMQGAVAAAVEPQRWAGGVVVTDGPPNATSYIGGHPLPDDGSLRAGAAIEELLVSAQLGPDDLVVASVSGGTSSLVALPVDGVTLDDLRAATADLLAAGIDVTRMNAVRARLSRFHGGGLLELAAPARVAALVLCDVVNGGVRGVGSAPTYAPPLTRDEAAAFVSAHVRPGLREQLLERLRADRPVRDCVLELVVGEPKDLAAAAVDAAGALGLHAELCPAPLVGEARHAARAFAGELRPGVLVGWGEVTVTLEDRGEGGRCREFALAAAQEIAGREACVVAVASDGRDFTPGVAGAWVDGTTTQRAQAAGLDLRAALDRHDSGPAHAALGQSIPGWRTGTNLCDLYLCVAGH